MPIVSCKSGGKSGYRVGTKGACYTYPDGDEKARKAAKNKAYKQWYAFAPEEVKQYAKSQASTEDFQDVDFQDIFDNFPSTTDDINLLLVANMICSDCESELDDELIQLDAYVSVEERKKLPLSDFGEPGKRGYPAHDLAHFKAAVRLIGRAPKSEQAAIKARLKRIAKRKGYPIPETWK